MIPYVSELVLRHDLLEGRVDEIGAIAQVRHHAALPRARLEPGHGGNGFVSPPGQNTRTHRSKEKHKKRKRKGPRTLHLRQRKISCTADMGRTGLHGVSGESVPSRFEAIGSNIGSDPVGTVQFAYVDKENDKNPTQ